MKGCNYALIAILAFSLLAFDANADTYTVSDLAGSHSGAGTLAWAINEANTATPNQRDTIDFDVGLSGTINLTIALPSLDDPEGVFIDGCNSGAGPHSITLQGGGTALHLTSYNNEICGLVIINCGIGILVEGSYNNLYDNYIGVESDGSTSGLCLAGIQVEAGHHGNIVGGEVGNVISGNYVGIKDAGLETTISGNFIGTDAGGNFKVTNGRGIEMGGLASTISGNVISGNFEGIYLTEETAIIQGNKIGTSFDGAIAVGNGVGIRIDGSGYHWIGGTGTGESNIISFNENSGISANDADHLTIIGNIFEGNGIIASSGGAIVAAEGCIAWTVTENEVFSNYNGVMVEADAVGIKITQNSIYGNIWLGIDLNGDGIINPNDPGDGDTGPNDLLNYPELSGVGLQGTACADCIVELYQTEEPPDASDHGEGYIYLASTTADGSGNFEFSCRDIPTDVFLTALAIDASGNTSEFSENLWVELLEITVLRSNEPDYGTLEDAINLANTHTGPVTITFAPGVGVSTDPIQPGTAFPALTNPFGVLIDGCSAPGGPHSVILDGLNLSVMDFGLTLASDNNEVCGLVIINCFGAAICIQEASYNTLNGNYIGVNSDGASNAPNGYGIAVMATASANAVNNYITNNLISGNNYSGVSLNWGNAVIVQGNLIGTDHSGTLRLPNGLDGIHILSDTGSLINDNIISGNDGDGVSVNQCRGTEIINNLIGTDEDKSVALHNGSEGIYLQSSNRIHIEGNLVSGNHDNGIFMDGCDSLEIINNIIGTDGLVSYDIPNGDDIAEAGIALQDCHFVDIYGTPANLDCGPVTGASIISGNFGTGIKIESCSTVAVTNTKLGYNCDNSLEILNRDGIAISNSLKINIGSLAPNQGNIIASEYKSIDISNSYVVNVKKNRVHSSDTAVYIHDGSHHCQVIENRITDNRMNMILKGSTVTNNLLVKNNIHHCVDGPDIDLWPPGITDMTGWDADSPNNMLNFPTYLDADWTSDLVRSNGPEGEVYIYLARDFSERLSGIFGSPATDCHGGALSYLGKTACYSTGFCDDVSGLGVGFGDVITAQSVDADNNTSEFGHNVLAVPWWAGGKCPILLEVEDPLGRVINSDSSQIPLAEYDTTDFSGDGEPDENINLSCQVVGEYKIRVFPKVEAQPGETYSLYIDGSYGDTVAVVLNAAVPEQGSYHEYLYEVDLSMPCDCEPGNCNGDGAINILDITFLINYLYKGGPLPIPYELCSADPGGNCSANILDITYLISFLYKGGPAPVDCENWLTSCGEPLRE